MEYNIVEIAERARTDKDYALVKHDVEQFKQRQSQIIDLIDGDYSYQQF